MKGADTCALCRRSKPLLESHIIPEFLYKPLYDSKHRLFRLSTGEKPKRAFEQKGLRERLLCEDCEGRFSRYEKYAKEVLFGGTVVQVASSAPQGFEFRVDYGRFKLFELSLLWRVGVTTLPEFNDVNLASHERHLRNMLRTESPGATGQYGCIKIWPISHRDIMDELVMSMGIVEVQGIRCCRLILGGMCWFFFLSSLAIHPGQEGLFLQDSGSLRIIRGDLGMPGYMRQLALDLCAHNQHLFRR